MGAPVRVHGNEEKLARRHGLEGQGERDSVDETQAAVGVLRLRAVDAGGVAHLAAVAVDAQIHLGLAVVEQLSQKASRPSPSTSMSGMKQPIGLRGSASAMPSTGPKITSAASPRA
jgi:hypothetical protein